MAVCELGPRVTLSRKSSCIADGSVYHLNTLHWRSISAPGSCGRVGILVRVHIRRSAARRSRARHSRSSHNPAYTTALRLNRASWQYMPG